MSSFAVSRKRDARRRDKCKGCLCIGYNLSLDQKIVACQFCTLRVKTVRFLLLPGFIADTLGKIQKELIWSFYCVPYLFVEYKDVFIRSRS